MPETMRHGTRRRYSAPRHRVHPVYRAAAPATGITAGSLHQGVPRWIERIAETIRAAMAIPDLAFVERALAPLDAARAGQPVPALTPEMARRTQMRAVAVLVALSEYRADPSLLTLRRLLRVVERHRGDLMALYLAGRETLQYGGGP